MPRQRRGESSTGMYHVVAKGINKERIFNQNCEKRQVMKLMGKHLKKYPVEIFSYCIMSNHIHLLIRSELKILSSYMAVVLAEFAEYYNYKHQRNGHVFQNRFSSECVESARYFWNCMRYIHLNPVKANIVKKPLNYKYSSLKEYEHEDIKLLHKSAIKIYKNEFADFEEYLIYHEKTSKQVFIDIPDEIKRQQEEIAISMIYQKAHVENLENVKEVIEDRELRMQYKSDLIKSLKISKKRTEELYFYVKNSIMEK